MKAVVLAGGKGARLSPYTKILPKPLMPIGDMPILEILLHQMRCAGVDEVILTVGYLAHLLESFFQGGQRYGLKIRYSLEDHPLGTAGPLGSIEDLDETFLVVNGDILTTLDLRALLAFHHASAATLTIATHARRVPVDLGVVQYNGTDEIIGYLEKPNYDFYVSMGIYVIEPRVLAYIPAGRYQDFPELVFSLLSAGERIAGYRYTGYWQDLGCAGDYEQAILDFPSIKHLVLPDVIELAH